MNDANRLKDEFLATLSHELRTPLNAILGYAQMLNMGALSDERRANAMVVLLRNAEALKQIIEDVLDVSRITSGKLRLKMRPVELGEILKDAAATVQPAADAKGVALQTFIGSAKYAEATGKHLAQLRNEVTSPGGTTAAGLQVLEGSGVRGAIIDAIEAAYNRSRELGE